MCKSEAFYETALEIDLMPAGVTTEDEIQLFPTAGVARLTFEEIGGDFESCLDG